jgi:hypothetical protein
VSDRVLPSIIIFFVERKVFPVIKCNIYLYPLILIYRVNTHDQRDLRYLTKIKWHTEMKLTPLEGELQTYFIACGSSDVTLMMTTRSAVVNMEVKCQLNIKCFVFSSSIPQNL